MERLRIEYGTGYMELNIEAFFPCKMPAARKAARLINSYCTDEARAELLSELRELADGYKALCDMYAEKAEGLPAEALEGAVQQDGSPPQKDGGEYQINFRR
ncbi:hypothetical protein C806_04930 [Lachnospiraceae bacterium 3-1]|nr:hypothetical protein C806_04930 [Lachnospiraceae bacterium 3-1]